MGQIWGGEHLFFGMLLLLFLLVSALGSGCWMARSLPVRFNGEEILIGFITGSLVALMIYGLRELMDNEVQPFQSYLTLGWFLLQGIAGEVTVQMALRRKGQKS